MTYGDKEMRGATLYAKLIQLLVHGEPASITTLARESGLHFRTVQRYIRALRDTVPHATVRIADWEEDDRGNRSIPCFQLGPGADMRRPKLTSKEKNRRTVAARQRKRSVFDQGAQQ